MERTTRYGAISRALGSLTCALALTACNGDRWEEALGIDNDSPGSPAAPTALGGPGSPTAGTPVGATGGSSGSGTGTSGSGTTTGGTTSGGGSTSGTSPWGAPPPVPPPLPPSSGGGAVGGGQGVALSSTPRVIEVRNDASILRTETLQASVPFAEGERMTVDDLAISGHETSWRVLQHWADGSVRVAQAQWSAQLLANSVTDFEVVEHGTVASGPFTANPWVESWPMQMAMVVSDTNDQRYSASVGLHAGRTLQETPMVRVTHQRVFHQPIDSGCIPRDFLSSHLYVTQFRDMPFVVVDWVLSNDYLGADDPQGSTDPDLFPLGGVDVNQAFCEFGGPTEVRPYLQTLNEIEPMTGSVPGVHAFEVMRDTWIDDGQTRRFRFHLRVEPASTPAGTATMWQQVFDARVDHPLFPLAEIEAWQITESLGIHGGPIDGPSGAWTMAQRDYDRWLERPHFGTWGSFGDVVYTGTSGTPRNTPLSAEVAHAIQSGHPGKSLMLEQKAWAQALRKYHTYGLQVGAEQNIYLYFPMAVTPVDHDITDESLGRRALWNNDPYPHLRTRVDHRAHGMNGYDINHWTSDLLFDYWTVSGDAWAQEELRLLGECAKGVMRLRRYQTINISNARAEGWVMQGFVQSYLATGDQSLRDYARRRIVEIIEPQRLTSHPARPIREQRPDPRTGWGPTVTYFPPWEHGSVILGFLGAYRHMDIPEALPIAEDVVHLIDYSWISNYTHPQTGEFTANAIRYWTPMARAGVPIPANEFDQTSGAYIPSNPLGSVNAFFVTGLDLLTRFSNDPYIRDRANWQFAHLYPEPSSGSTQRWNKWYLVAPRYYGVHQQGN